MKTKRPLIRDIFAYIGLRRTLFLYATAGGALVLAFLGLNSGMPRADIYYVWMLLGAPLLIVALPDFFRFRRRLTELEQALGELAGFEQDLPEGTNALERAYAQIATGFRVRAEAEKAAIIDSHHASEAYFTQWMHEIKTPIAALRLLLDAPQLDKALFSRQLFEVERYAQLAMQYVRSEDISGDLVLVKTPLEPVVRECIKKYAPLFIAKRLYAEVSPLALAPVTDAKWLAFILEQLLSNAIKYTETGGVRIYLSGSTLVLEDTGVGIRLEDVARVFERGYTGHNGRLDKRATGIGLYLAQRASNALGIGLSLDSTPGEGTRVLLTFPVNPLAFE